MREVLSFFVEDNEKSAFVMMANGTLLVSVACTHANIRDKHPRNTYIVIRNNYLILHYMCKT